MFFTHKIVFLTIVILLQSASIFVIVCTMNNSLWRRFIEPIIGIIEPFYIRIAPSSYLIDTPLYHRDGFHFRDHTCLHEAGHMILAFFCTEVKDITDINVFANGAGNIHYTHRSSTVSGMWADIVIVLGGMMAEIGQYGYVHTDIIKGDLRIALRTSDQLERQGEIIAPWPKLPSRKLPDNDLWNDATSTQRLILRQAYAMAHHLFRVHHQNYIKLVNVLIDKSKDTLACRMDTFEIENILGPRWFIGSILSLLPGTLFVGTQHQEAHNEQTATLHHSINRNSRYHT